MNSLKILYTHRIYVVYAYVGTERKREREREKKRKGSAIYKDSKEKKYNTFFLYRSKSN